jgi:hypothetical protein
MAAMFPGRMPAAGSREPMDAPELIEGRGLAVDIDRGAARHDGPFLDTLDEPGSLSAMRRAD